MPAEDLLILCAALAGLVTAPAVPALGIGVEVVGHAALVLALAPVSTEVDARRDFRPYLC